jgi:lysozyme family protein
MDPKIDLIISGILQSEGDTYTNDPVDLGGPTKYGITLRTLTQYRGHVCTAQDVENLTEQEARDIYEYLYVHPFRITYGGDPDLLHLIVDSAVQHGVARVQSWLNEIMSLSPTEQYRALLKRRIRLYGRIITDRPANARFAAGWMNRVTEFLR